MLSAQTNEEIPYRLLPDRVIYSRHTFSWAYEIRQFFCHTFLNVITWPLFKTRHSGFTRTLLFRQCKKLQGFKELWSTVQKSSFAYNTLFLEMKPFQKSFSRTELADITTLTLLLGDEFIDGVRQKAGTEFILQLIKVGTRKFYLRKKIVQGSVRLEYSFDLLKLLTPDILEGVNKKYNISYRKFYYLLKSLLQHINRLLEELDYEKANQVADKLSDVCNTCLDSYLYDINDIPEQDKGANIETILNYHDLKSRYMQRRLLDVRCTLVNREDAMHTIRSQGWINIMSVAQIYDDMLDICIDDGFQDNLLLCVARANFPVEWKWFTENKNILASCHPALHLSLFMPSSVQYCLHLVAEKIRGMNWEQQKIVHYLLNRNWFVQQKNIPPGTGLKNDVAGIYYCVKDKMQHLPDDAIKSYAVEVCFHQASARNTLLKKVNMSLGYQLRYNLLSLPNHIKVGIFSTITKK